MADRNYVTSDFASRLERARRKIDRRPQPRLVPNLPRPPVPPIVSSLFRVYNNGDETIPQFAVMQVEDLSERTGFAGNQEDAYAVKQPDGGGSLFLINAGDEIKQGRFGAGALAFDPSKIAMDPDADPDTLDSFGPVKDEWHLAAHGSGFLYLGKRDEDEEAGTSTGIFRMEATSGIVVRNDASETAPAYGILRVTGDATVGSTAIVKVAKPSTSNTIWLINGPHDIAAGGFGLAFTGTALAKHGTGTPAFGETWGPENNQWTLKEGNAGAKVIGAADTDNARVIVKQVESETPSYASIVNASISHSTDSGTPTKKVAGIFSAGNAGPTSGSAITLDAGDDRCEINEDGNYEITFRARTRPASTVTNSQTWEIYKNGSAMTSASRMKDLFESPLRYDGSVPIQALTMVRNRVALVAGDYLEVYVTFSLTDSLTITDAVFEIRKA